MMKSLVESLGEINDPRAVNGLEHKLISKSPKNPSSNQKGGMPKSLTVIGYLSHLPILISSILMRVLLKFIPI